MAWPGQYLASSLGLGMFQCVDGPKGVSLSPAGYFHLPATFWKERVRSCAGVHRRLCWVPVSGVHRSSLGLWLLPVQRGSQHMFNWPSEQILTLQRAELLSLTGGRAWHGAWQVPVLALGSNWCPLCCCA